MKEPLHTFEEILRNNNLHVTKARKQVFMALYDQPPQSIHTLRTKLQGSIDRTSIYRSVELFEKLSIVHRIQIGWKYKIELSEAFTEHHHHISCLSCGRIVAIKENETIEALIATIAQQQGFSNSTHQLEIQGNCTHCS